MIAKEAAKEIAAGKILGWYQGRAEWGPRALGNRSIVADPRRPDMKDILNARIKHREMFRPFAPSILAESTGDYFEKSYPCPFMTQAYSVRPEKREVIPAPTHVDGTGRLQTVSQEANPRYWGLIREFANLTGVPVVLNTSFNDNEPIVCRPEEAIECFLRTKMDVLVLGDMLVRKPERLPRVSRAGSRSVAIGFHECESFVATSRRFFSAPDEPVHILLLNEYFPPDTSATAKCAAQVAESLSVNHRVTVLAGRPSYDPSERHARYLLRREVRGNLAVERVGSTAYPRFQMRRRVTNYLTYLSLAVPRALSISSDIVLAMTDPPIEGIAGALVARLSGRPFVYNIRDMYPDMAVGGSIVPPGSFTARWESMHRWALRRAARVIVLGEDMRDRIVAKGVEPARVVISRDGVLIPEALPSPENSVAREIRGDFRFALVHAGKIGFYGAWQTLISAVRML